MVPHHGDRIDDWWSRGATIAGFHEASLGRTAEKESSRTKPWKKARKALSSPMVGRAGAGVFLNCA